jgi:hypothetical protein
MHVETGWSAHAFSEGDRAMRRHQLSTDLGRPAD